MLGCSRRAVEFTLGLIDHLMRTFKPDPVSFSAHQLHFCFTATDLVISSGSGFIYAKDETSYLITNWHNVAGKNPETGSCLSKTLAIPDVISIIFRMPGALNQGKREQLRLYRDDEMHEPAWYVHPTLSHDVDVVAIPLPRSIVSTYAIFPINRIEFDEIFPAVVGDDAFVIGFPFSEPVEGQFPIWKRASVASEPEIDIDRLPKVLIDTATRPGLSGSPVIMQRAGLHGVAGAALSPDTIIGTIRNFIGIYSGRVGADEVKAQLGIVWKHQVIKEILEAKVHGRPPYEA
jgi:S1-C subfamily serine protease